MRKLLAIGIAVLAFARATYPQTTAGPTVHPSTPRRPKLVIAIVIDQFRYDYLLRFRSEYTGGFATLMRNGAFFTNARYPQFPTFTAVGHSIMLSGAPPYLSGIVGNAWYSREEHRVVTSVCDDHVSIVGQAKPTPPDKPGADCTDASPASPRRMLVDTVGDELRMADDRSRVIGVSLKPRSAILPAGHTANGAYWFDSSGVFVTSSYYMKQLPKWADDFNHDDPTKPYENKEWMGLKFTSGADLVHAIPTSPFGNELVENFAEAAIDGEQLGKRGVTDILTISFSSNDYVGHRFGPDDPHVRDMAIRTDHLIDRLFHFLNARGLALDDILVTVSADHGVAPLPEKNAERGMPGGRLPEAPFGEAVKAALSARFGAGDWVIEKPFEGVLYLSQDQIRSKNLDVAEVDRVAASAIASLPHVFRVFTREQLLNGWVPENRISQAEVNGFFPARSGDIFFLLDPDWLLTPSGTTHGTPFNYDTQVPLILMGTGIRPGRYHANVSIADLAPTLSTLLGLSMPSGADGRTLSEAFSDN